MKPTLTISDIYATPARARVLETLAYAAAPLSTRAVARAAGISHTAAGAVLRDLEAMNLVICSPVGRASAHVLNRNSVYVRHMVLAPIDAEQLIIKELADDLTTAFSALSQSLILFGSYATGEQETSSDIDVFALAADARGKQLLREKADQLLSVLLDKYGATLSLMAFTRHEAAEHLRSDRSSFRTELASTGIILHGLGVNEWGISDGEDPHEGSIASYGPAVPGQS